MANMRVKFIRGEAIRYISHLELMKTFERILRRSKLPIIYSQGFNPHPHMVFGLPLSVGVTSDAEYADFEIADGISKEEFVSRFNSEAPEGLRIVEACFKSTKDNIMALISMADYKVYSVLDSGVEREELTRKIRCFMDRSEIVAKKEGKQGLKDINIRPMILKLEECGICGSPSDGWPEYSNDSTVCIVAQLAAGNTANLKPELLMKAFNDITGPRLKVLRVHRTGLYVNKAGKVLDPLDAAAL